MALSDKNHFYSHCSRNLDEICLMYIFFLLEFDANSGTHNNEYTMHVQGIHSDYEIYLIYIKVHLNFQCWICTVKNLRCYKRHNIDMLMTYYYQETTDPHLFFSVLRMSNIPSNAHGLEWELYLPSNTGTILNRRNPTVRICINMRDCSWIFDRWCWSTGDCSWCKLKGV